MQDIKLDKSVFFTCLECLQVFQYCFPFQISWHSNPMPICACGSSVRKSHISFIYLQSLEISPVGKSEESIIFSQRCVSNSRIIIAQILSPVSNSLISLLLKQEYVHKQCDTTQHQNLFLGLGARLSELEAWLCTIENQSPATVVSQALQFLLAIPQQLWCSQELHWAPS